MSSVGICQTYRAGIFLSDLLRLLLIVKLNALEGLGGGRVYFFNFQVVTPQWGLVAPSCFVRYSSIACAPLFSVSEKINKKTLLRGWKSCGLMYIILNRIIWISVIEVCENERDGKMA